MCVVRADEDYSDIFIYVLRVVILFSSWHFFILIDLHFFPVFIVL